VQPEKREDPDPKWEEEFKKEGLSHFALDKDGELVEIPAETNDEP
jgi:hypothetical protein